MKDRIVKTLTALVLLSMCVSGQKTVCAIYFTGIGCPHCAQTDPYLFGELLYKYNKSLVIIEYEVYQERENPPYVAEYDERYGVGYGIPRIVFGRGDVMDGDRNIVDNMGSKVGQKTALGEACLLLGSKTAFEELDFNAILGKPKIWMGNKVLFKADKEANASSDLLRRLLLSDDIPQESAGYNNVEPAEIPFSGGSVTFNKAIAVDGWVLQWNEGENRKNSISYSLDHYMTLIPLLVITAGVAILLSMKMSEKKKKGGA